MRLLFERGVLAKKMGVLTRQDCAMYGETATALRTNFGIGGNSPRNPFGSGAQAWYNSKKGGCRMRTKLPQGYDAQKIKLGVLYLLQEAEYGLERAHIERVMLDETFGHIAYFDLTQAIAELKTSGQVIQHPFRGRSVLELAPPGEVSLKQFISRLPASLRGAIDSYLAANRKLLEKQASIGADYRCICKGEYLAELWMYEGDIEILHLRLNVSSGSQAAQLCEGWYRSFGKCYQLLLSTLLEGVV